MDPVKRESARLGNKRLYYTDIGEGRPTIILLGWMSDVDSFPYFLFEGHKANLKNNQFIFVHLSNFYKSSVSEEPMELNDYVREMDEFVQAMGVKKINLIGHSAGGRIAMCFAISHPNKVSSLILLNSAGLKHADASEDMIKRAHQYFVKHDIDQNSREKKTLEITLKNLYNTNLRPQLYKISCPTLIVWGREDKTIDISRAWVLMKKIPEARLVVYPDLGHDTLRDPRIIEEIFRFLKDNHADK